MKFDHDVMVPPAVPLPGGDPEGRGYSDRGENRPLRIGLVAGVTVSDLLEMEWSLDLTKITEEEFLCVSNLVRSSDLSHISAADMEVVLLEHGIEVHKCPPIRHCGSFKIIRLSAEDTGLLNQYGKLVGYYIGEGLVIDENARNKQLSVPLILEAISNRPIPQGRKVTEAGEAALRKAWRVANRKETNPWWKLL